MTGKSYRADIDGLRALAVVLVVLFHAGLPWVAGGFIGVDVFFVISGYLVTGLIERELEANTFSFRAFLQRRIRRLLPAALTMIFVTALVASFLLAPTSFLSFARSLAMSAAYLANVHFWLTANYFAEAAEFLPLLHMWSLAVEEQYYLVAPLLGVVAHRVLARFTSPRRSHLAVLAFATVVSFLFAVWSTERIPTSAFFLLPSRFWELGVGAVLALVPSAGFRRTRSASGAAAVGIAVIIGAALIYDSETLFPGTAAVAPVVGASLILIGGRTPATFTSSVLAHPALRWLGLRSYALYLWHWPLLVLARHAVLRPLHPHEVLGVLVVVVLVAHLSFKVIEERFRYSKSLPPFVFAFGSALGGWLFFFSVHAADGFPGRFARTEPAPAPRPTEKNPCSLSSRVVNPAWDKNDCVLKENGHARVLLWGDSMAGHYRHGFQSVESVPGTIWQYTTTVCPPIEGWRSVARPACEEFNERALKMVEKGDFDVVVMAARWEYVVKRPGGLAGLRATLARLKTSGVEVVLIGQTPIFPIDPRALYVRNTSEVSFVSTTTQHAEVNIKLQSALLDGIHFVDPSTAFCTGLTCRYFEQGQFLFDDNAHLSSEGSDAVVERAITPAVHSILR